MGEFWVRTRLCLPPRMLFDSDSFHLLRSNIFYVRQYIDYLHKNSQIYYSMHMFRWEWEDLATIQDTSGESDDVGAIVSKKIMSMVCGSFR